MQSVPIATKLWVRILLRPGVLDTTLCDPPLDPDFYVPEKRQRERNIYIYTNDNILKLASYLYEESIDLKIILLHMFTS
jgi:hypothetical protein